MITRPRALVTGAAGTIGYYLCEGLIQSGIDVIGFVRNETRGQHLKEKLQSYTATVASPTALGTLHTVACDLSDRASIQSAVNSSILSNGKPLDIVINNAAFTSPEKVLLHGIEAQWNISVLGYHRILKAALPALKQAKTPRAVFVSAIFAGDLDLTDVEFNKRPYDKTKAYKQSKEADRMLAKAWADHEPWLSIYSCQPGVAASAVARGLGFKLDESAAAAKAAAINPLFCATAPVTEIGPSGSWIVNKQAKPCSFSANTEKVKALWDLVEKYN